MYESEPKNYDGQNLIKSNTKNNDIIPGSLLYPKQREINGDKNYNLFDKLVTIKIIQYTKNIMNNGTKFISLDIFNENIPGHFELYEAK